MRSLRNEHERVAVLCFEGFCTHHIRPLVISTVGIHIVRTSTWLILPIKQPRARVALLFGFYKPKRTAIPIALDIAEALWRLHEYRVVSSFVLLEPPDNASEFS